MRAGKLRHRIQIQKATITRADSGAETKTWQTIARRWGEFIPQGGVESLNAGQVQAVTGHQLKLRFWADLTVENRVIVDTLTGPRIFDVNSITNPDMRGMEGLLTLTEVPTEEA